MHKQAPAFGTTASYHNGRQVIATAQGPTFATEEDIVDIVLLKGATASSHSCKWHWIYKLQIMPSPHWTVLCHRLHASRLVPVCFAKMAVRAASGIGVPKAISVLEPVALHCMYAQLAVYVVCGFLKLCIWAAWAIVGVRL